MANANSTIEIELEIKQALDRLNRLERELQKSAQQMQKAADATGKLEGALNKAKTAAAGLFAFFSGQQIVEAADQFTNFANAVRISTSSVAEQTAVQKELYRVAQTTGSSLGDISKLYGRLRQAADQLGSSQAETIKITEIVGKALAASGTSASEASGALLQLAQALNSPRVQAEEFNSLVDAMPNLLRQVERQLGITAGGLKKFVTDGQLSNKLFRDAILGSAAAIDDQFGKANDTIATALTRLNNAFILLVGNFEESTGFFNKTAAIISGLAENMDELVRVLKAVAVGFAIAFAPKVIRAIRDTATAMATLGAASKTNVIGALAALGFYIADITGGMDLLTEKLGLTKDASEETADAIADLTKVSGGGVAAIAPVVPQPSQEYLTSLENIREFFGNEAANSQFILQALEQYSNYTSQILSDAATGGVDQIKSVSGQVLTFNQAVEESRHLLQLLGLAYEQALGREAGESANVLALQFLAAQQAMKVLLDLRDQELAVIAEVEARIAAINERGIERTESERIILRYQNEIAEVMADETFSLLQRERIVKALESARDRELENAKEVLSFQEMITEELQTQLGLSSEVAGTIASGYFSAGPNAARAGQIGQAYAAGGGGATGLANAAAALVLSNEKVSAAIEEQFTLLFDTIDPLLEILADLQSAITRLIKALLNAGQGLLDTVGLGQDSYLFGGGFARDLENAFSSRSKSDQPTKLDIASQLSANVFDIQFEESPQQQMQPIIDELADFLPNIELDKIIETIKQKSAQAVDANNEALEVLYNSLQPNAAYNKEIIKQIKELNAANQEIQENTQIIIDGIINEFMSVPLQALADLSASAENEIKSLNDLNLSREEQIKQIYDENIAIIELQKGYLDLINSEEKRAELLAEITAAEEKQLELYQLQIQQFTEASNALTDAAISDIQRRGLVFSEQQEIEYRYAKEIAAAQENTNLTTADQIRLVNALEAARQREIDALERSSYLLDLQSAQSGLAEILRNFEDAIEGIREIVQGLFDQVTELLFSEFNLMPVMDQFELASDRYAALLEQAFDPNATEEDITNLQAFVNEYLSAARDVYKSSSRFQSIFDQVLQDLTVLGLQYGFTAPVGAVATTRSDVSDLAEELGVSMESLIEELDRLAIEFANQQLEFIGEVLQVDFAEIIDIQFPDSLDLGEITFTYSLADIDLGMITPTATLTTNTINLGEVTPEFTLSAIDLGSVAATGRWASTTVNLGTVNATASFNTSGFVNALNTAISQIQTAIDNAASSVSGGSTGSGAGVPEETISPFGFNYEKGPFTFGSPGYQIKAAYTSNTDMSEMASFGAESIANQILEYNNTFGSPGSNFRYAISYNSSGQMGVIQFYENLNSARDAYDSKTRADMLQYITDTNVKKFGFRQGGLVPDPMDTIPAMLSPGEYILSPETVRRFGVSSLNQLNSGDASAISQTNDPEVKRLLAELIQAVRENDTEVNVYTDMRGQAKAAVEEFRSEIKERSRRQGDQFIPVRYI